MMLFKDIFDFDIFNKITNVYYKDIKLYSYAMVGFFEVESRIEELKERFQDYPIINMDTYLDDCDCLTTTVILGDKKE